MTVRLIARDLSIHFPLTSGRGQGAAVSGSRIGLGDEAQQGQAFVKALDDVTFEAKPGDRLAIIGENGAGKSTLLRTLAGIYPPTTGEVEIAGKLAVLFQPGLGVVPEATGYQNIRLIGLFQGLTSAEIEEATPSIIEFADLGEFLHLPMSCYSAGMRMRLTFAVATATSPEILLLDEMIGVGDKAFIDRAMSRRRDFLDKASIMVLSSHARILIEQTCNRAIWLKQGKLVADGPVTEVLDAYHGSGDSGTEKQGRAA